MNKLFLSLFILLSLSASAQQIFPRYEGTTSDSNITISINEATTINLSNNSSSDVNSSLYNRLERLFPLAKESAKKLNKQFKDDIKTVKYAKNSTYEKSVQENIYNNFFAHYNSMSKLDKKLYVKLINRELGFPVYTILKKFRHLPNCKINKLSASLNGIPINKKYAASRNQVIENAVSKLK